MARLGGMSTESFSSARECLSAASVGLGAILRDQKTMPSSSRCNVLLGLSTPTSPAAAACALSNSPVHSLVNSPIESNSFLDEDDPDDHKEEDICAAEMRESRNSQPLGLTLSASHGYDGWNHGCDPTFRHGFSHAHTVHPQNIHAHQQRQGRAHLDSHKQQRYAMNGTRHARHQIVDKGVGLSDAIMTSAAVVRLSPLSMVSGSQPVRKPAWKTLTPSQTIPGAERCTSYDIVCHSKHQSAPVNVPNRSKILPKPASRASSMDEIGEDDAERLPPHELLAKEYAQSQIMTSSVCEGQGRTLKGRDMRRMRNAVWRQSGFAD